MRWNKDISRHVNKADLHAEKNDLKRNVRKTKMISKENVKHVDDNFNNILLNI